MRMLKKLNGRCRREPLIFAAGLAIVVSAVAGFVQSSRAATTDLIVGLVPKNLDLTKVLVFQENRDRIDGSSTAYVVRFKGKDFLYVQQADADSKEPFKGDREIGGTPVQVSAGSTNALWWVTPKDLYVSNHLLLNKAGADNEGLANLLIRQFALGKSLEGLGDVEVRATYRESSRALSMILADGTRLKSVENLPVLPKNFAEAWEAIMGAPPVSQHQDEEVDNWIWDPKETSNKPSIDQTRSIRLSEVKKIIGGADRQAAKVVPGRDWISLSKDIKLGLASDVDSTACLKVKAEAVCGKNVFVSRLIKNRWYIADKATDRLTARSAKSEIKPSVVFKQNNLTYTVVEVPENVNAVQLTVRRNLRFETVTVERPLW
jgi:hypothetical protein